MVVPDEPTDAIATAVEAEVARTLAPSPELLARLGRAREELLAAVRQAASRRNSPMVRAIVAGSAARETFLSDRLDIDLFLLFPPDLPDERLREEGLALAREVLTSPTMRYAEHPYLRGKFAEFTVDAVPGFAVSDPSRPRSPVDRTPFHQEYLSSRESPHLVSEIRLAKQFLRARGVYGSEARTEGFSGYLLELLVLEFGSFRGFLRAARDWRIPVRLESPESEPPRLPAEVALVLADPVDPNRNVATALSRRNLGVLIVSARRYLERPDRAWFAVPVSRPFPLEEARRRVADRASHVTIVRLARPDLVDDTLYPQLRKAERSIADELLRAGFAVLGSSSAADAHGLVIAVELASPSRSAVRHRPGPPAGLDRAGDFLASWPAEGPTILQGPYVRPDGTLAVETRESERGPEGFLAVRLPRLSLGRNLTAGEGAEVGPLDKAVDSEALQEALCGLLAKGLPWPALAPLAEARRR
jgi:tRNA nucleotidyltransferase (CCA-adding enzyme)